MKDIGEQVRRLLPEYPHLWSRVIGLLEKAAQEQTKANGLTEAAQAQVNRWWSELAREIVSRFENADIAGAYGLQKAIVHAIETAVNEVHTCHDECEREACVQKRG